MTFRAVILARGLGTRMRQAEGGATLAGEQAVAADAGLKAMIPIGRPFIDYILGALADAGCNDACLVIGPEHAGVRAYFEEAGPRRVSVRFAVQAKPLGTADAVLAAEEFTAGGRFMVLNGDNYYPVAVAPDRIERFAVLDIGPDGSLRSITEKPDAATLARFGSEPRVGMNCWMLDARIFPWCRTAALSPRGERELPLVVQAAIAAGAFRVRAVPVEASVLDLSSRRDVAAVTARLAGVVPRP